MDLSFKENRNGNLQIREAARCSGYSTGYLSYLCRTGKIVGKYSHNEWSIDAESLEGFIKAQAERKEARARALANSRALEYRGRQAPASAPTAPEAPSPKFSVQRTDRANVGLTKSHIGSSASFFSGAVATAVALVVVTAGALAAQEVVPSLANRTAAAASYVAFGFRETFGGIPVRIAEKMEDAKRSASQNASRAAATIASASENIASPFLAEPDFSFLNGEFADGLQNSNFRHPMSEIGFHALAPAFTSDDARPVRDHVSNGARAFVFNAYRIFSSPSRAADAIAGAHAALGGSAYAAIEGAFSAYRSLIEKMGARSLMFAVILRDTAAHMPQFVSGMNLAFGSAVIHTANLAIRADVSLAYALAEAAPTSARATFALMTGTGAALARGTERLPSLAARAYWGAVSIPAEAAPAIAERAFALEYAGALTFVRAGDATGESARQNARRIADNAAGAASSSFAFLNNAPINFEDAYLSALGKGALVFEHWGDRMSKVRPCSEANGKVGPCSMPGQLLAAVLPTLSAGERLALATYETIQGIFDSANRMLAFLLGPPPNVAVAPSPPIRSAATTITATTTQATYTTIVQGITPVSLDQSLAALRASILATVTDMINPVASRVAYDRIYDYTETAAFNGGSVASDVSAPSFAATDASKANTFAGTFSAGTTTVKNLAVTNTSTSTFAGPIASPTGDLTVAAYGSAYNLLLNPYGGKVGIGTTTPYASLSVAGLTVDTPTLAIVPVAGQTANIFDIYNPAGDRSFVYTASGLFGIGTTAPASLLDIVQPANGTPILSARRITDTAPSGDFVSYKTADGATTLFRVDNSGNLLAGGIINSGSQTITSVSAPQFRVQYDASNEITQSVNLTGTTTIGINGTAPGLVFTPQSNLVNQFNFTDASSNSLLSLDTLNKRVGIGTTTPTVNLTVYGSATGNFGAYATPLRVESPNYAYLELLTQDANQAGLLLNNAGSTGWFYGINGSGNLRIADMSAISQAGLDGAKDGSEGITVTTAGNVGIGTKNPSANLQIGNYITMQQVANVQALYGWNLYFDGSNWKYINADKAAAIRMNGGSTINGDITFHTEGAGAAGGTISDMDTTGVKMVIKNGGNVGIGITNPNAILSLGQAVQTNKLLVFDGGTGANNNYGLGISAATLQIYSGTETNGKIAFGSYNGTSFSELMRIQNNGEVGVGTTTPWGQLSASSTSAYPTLAVEQKSTGPAAVFLGGNVGIGTAAPATKLHILASAPQLRLDPSSDASFGQFNLAGSGVSRNANFYITNSDTGNLYLRTSATADDPQTALTIDNTQNVGIGIAPAPDVKFYVFGANIGVAKIKGGNSFADLQLEGGAAGDVIYQLLSGYPNIGDFTIREHGVADYLTIKKTTGNVGIGTTTPDTALSVQGTYATSLRPAGIHMRGNIPGISFETTDSNSLSRNFSIMNEYQSYGQLNFNYSSVSGGNPDTAAMTINSSGNVGIGTTTPSNLLSISGATIPSIGLNVVGTTGNWVVGIDTADANKFKIASSTAVGTNTRLTIDGSGNVGIGATNPLLPLQVKSNTASPSQATQFTTNTWTTSTGSTFQIGFGAASGNTYSDIRALVDGYNTWGDMVLQSGGGNVGIGVTNPQVTFQGGNSATGRFGARARTDGANIGGLTGLNLAEFGGWYSTGANPASAIHFVAQGSTGGQGAIAFLTSPTDTLGTDPSIRMVIDKDGNVGIGTTSPATNLHIYGSNHNLLELDRSSGTVNTNIVFAQSNVAKAYVGIAGATNGIVTGSVSGDLGIRSEGGNILLSTDSGVTANMYIKNGGNVGIGTTTPAALLQVNGGTTYLRNTSDFTGVNSDILQVGRNDDLNNAYLGIGANQTSQYTYIQSKNAGVGYYSLLLNPNGGNVGIGTTTPFAKFVISTGNSGVSYAGNASQMIIDSGSTNFIDLLAPADNTAGIRFDVGADTRGGILYYGQSHANVDRMDFFTAGALSMSIKSGNVGIGTTTPQRTLHVQGNVCLDLNADYACTDNTSAISDARLKTNVTDLSGSLALVNRLRPVRFNWNGEYNTGHAPSLGFIAQEVETVFPELVITDTAGYKNLDYGKLTAALAGAVQTLDARTKFIGNAAEATSTVLTVDVAGNIGIGAAGAVESRNLAVSGDVSAASYEAPLAAATPFSYGTTTLSAEIPAAVLTAAGSVNLYKLATYNLSGIASLAARFDAVETRVTSLEDRVAALESGAITSASTSLSTSTLASALNAFGVYISKGFAQFGTLIADQFVAASDSAGTSSAGTIVILAGNTVAQANNAYVHPTSKIFATLNSSITGSWYITDKQEGSFRLVLSAAQPADVSFDYFIVQTDGQVATTTAATGETAPSTTLSGGSTTTTTTSMTSTSSASSSTLTTAATTATTTTTTASSTSSGDTTPPVVTLNGDAAVQIMVGTAWTDPGATALDNVDGDLTNHIKVSGTVNTAVEGLYVLTYSATDAAGNTGSASRAVSVVASATSSSSTTATSTSSTDTTTSSSPTTSTDTGTTSTPSTTSTDTSSSSTTTTDTTTSSADTTTTSTSPTTSTDTATTPTP